MLYRQSLENVGIYDSFEVTFIAGTIRFTCTFSWNTENQEQWDAFERAIETLAKTDPLVEEGKPYDRTYDYIDWYMQFDDCSLQEAVTGDVYKEYRERLQSMTAIPNSIRKYDFDNQLLYADVVIPRLEACRTLDARRTLYKECAVWQCKLSYENDTRVVRVVPGGWAYNQDNIFRFRFTTNKDTIGYDDLNLVSLEVYTNE